MTLGFFIRLWPLAHFIWPPAPGWSAEHIAHFFQTDTVAKRAGSLIAMLATGLLAPFYAVISNQLRRIEGASKPWTNSQLAAGACRVLEIILPLMLWQGIAYRPHRDPAMTQTLNDISWLIFVGTTTTGTRPCRAFPPCGREKSATSQRFVCFSEACFVGRPRHSVTRPSQRG